MEQVQRHFIDQFTPEKIGIFWLTPSALNPEMANFHNFNYLCDGLISQLISQENEMAKQKANLFLGQNFSRPFFIAHINGEGLTHSQISGEIDEQIAAVQSLKGENNKVFVLDLLEGKWHQELKKRYPQFDFIELKS